ncbi:MAG: DUF1631 family protein [Pseudoxanthomonas sp.]
MEQSPPGSTVANPRLLGLMRETVLPPLLDAFADVVDGLREPLLERGGRQGGDLSPLIEGLYLLRQQRDVVLGAYRIHLVKAWQLLESGAPFSSQLAFDSRTSKVDLVDHDELEVQLAIHHLAGALTREWQAELLALNNYLAWVDPGLRMAADSNPFSPAQIAMAVYEGFNAIALPGPMRISSVVCCEHDLVELVGPIYESVYNVLTQQFGAPDSGSTQGRQAHIPSTENELIEPEPDWLSKFFVEWEGPGRAADPSAAAPANSGRAGLQDITASTLPQALHQLLEQSRFAREQVQGRNPSQAGPRNTLSQRELISILTLLQIAPDTAIAAMVQAEGPLLPRLKKQMFQTASQLGVEAGAVKLSASDENIVDLIGMLFQVMFDECELSAAQREVMGKLIAPMTKVALQDRQLFLQSTHPARRLLNVLTEACEGNRGESVEERELLEKVEATVGRLTLEFDESQAVFRTLRGDFNAYYAEYKRHAELAEREVAERQRLEDALERARNTLQSRLDHHTSLPKPVRGILQAGWVAHASVLEAGGRGHTALMQLDGLLQALDTAQSGSGASSSCWEPVADWLQPVWMSMGKLRPEIAEARTSLIETLRVLASQPAIQSVAQADVEPEPALVDVHASHVIGPLSREELQDAVDFDNVTADYFSRLPVGTWLDFIDRDNRVQAGKLSWVSPISSRLLFVSRSGTRIAVASPQELAIMVKLNRLRLHRADDAFYSAMQGVVDRLQPAAA